MDEVSMMSQPAVPLPPGQVRNMEHPPSDGYLLIITVVVCLTVSTFMVWTRMYVSFRVTRKPTWDDGLVFASWLVFIAYSGINLDILPYGGFTDIWNVTLEQLVVLARLRGAIEILYIILLCTTKLSVLVLYKRAFLPVRSRKSWMSYLIIFVIGFNGVFYLTSVLTIIFSCSPSKKVWNVMVPGKCINMFHIYVITATVNLLSDLLMISIPVVVLWNLQMRRQKKVEMAVIFGFITLSVAASAAIIGFATFEGRGVNPTRNLKCILWAYAELSACFVTSCVPMVPHLVKRVTGTSRSSQGTPFIQSESQRLQRSTQLSGRKVDGTSKWLGASSLCASGSLGEDPYLMFDDVESVFSRDLESDRVSTGSSEMIKVPQEREIVVINTVDISVMNKH